MVWIEESFNIDFKKLANPAPLFKIFVPNEEKLKKIANHLMEGPLNLSDEFRNYDIIHAMLRGYLVSPSSLFYEIGDMQALLGFTNIIPRFKATVLFKLFDPGLWGFQFKRQGKEVFRLVSEILELKRLSSETPDPRIVRIAKMVGFTIEGMKKNDFIWNRKLYNTYILGLFSNNEQPKTMNKFKKRRKKCAVKAKK